MKHPLFKGNQFLQRVVAPASESLESEESLAQREKVQPQEEGNESGSPYSLPVQAKLTIGEPGDKYEQEADRVASQVVKQINSPEAAQLTQGQSSISDLQRSPLPLEVQREAMPEEEELQAKSILQRREAIAGGEASTDLESAINSARGGGQPLEAGLQRSMGQAMGADFSGVKVHTDAKSDQLNQSIQAKAFTTGQDVFFRQGAYEPGSRGGQELIAHELTHVVQQNGEGVQRSPLPQPQLTQHPATETPTADFSHVDLFTHAPQRSPIQAKLNVGVPDDQHEKDTKRVADQENNKIHTPTTRFASIQRRLPSSAEEQKIEQAWQLGEEEPTLNGMKRLIRLTLNNMNLAPQAITQIDTQLQTNPQVGLTIKGVLQNGTWQ
jgi:hypothetical protein